ncbi:GYF domain-containing protein [Prevotella sp. KH2C16]|uniref:GYF domain-containing protein n=1 Tax=Prevotella sp. KH2C16 TaxID=1855325 RepID=UPI0008E213E4|nr:GYF domain-containing protein [Prevotella sp. KH2C16]SFG25247.1 protein of unknown function [Prevotella sp. KH2C16]
MKYFIIENNQQAGPFSIYELKDKGLASDTLVWAEGMKDWTPAWQVDELKNFLYNTTGSSTPPPVPPTAAQPAADNTPQDDREEEQEPRKRHTWLIVGGIVAALLIVLFLTNPDKEDHKRVILDRIAAAVEDEDSDEDPISQGFEMLGKMLAREISAPMLDTALEYHNYGIFSTTTIRWGKKSYKSSYGILGHIFTVDEDDITKILDKKWNDPQDGDEEGTGSEGGDTYAQNSTPQGDTCGSRPSDDNSLDARIIDGVGNLVKDKVKEQTDSATGEGLGRIIDGIVDFIKGKEN